MYFVTYLSRTVKLKKEYDCFTLPDTAVTTVIAYGDHFSSADMFLALDKDMNGTLSKQELREYADGTLTDIFIERGRNLYMHFSFVNCLKIWPLCND